jgi:hypothetical protein
LGGLERGGESKKSMSPHNSKSNHHDEELEGDQSFSWLNLGSSPKSYFASPDLCLAQRIEAIAQKIEELREPPKVSLSIRGRRGLYRSTFALVGKSLPVVHLRVLLWCTVCQCDHAICSSLPWRTMSVRHEYVQIRIAHHV